MDDLKYVGEFALERLEIVLASRNEPFNLRGNFMGLVLYEDIFEPVLSGDLLISDPISLATVGPITGQEELLIKLKTPTISDPDKIIEFVDQPLIITSISKRQAIANDIEGYVLSFTTRQILKDRRTKISKSLTGTYSDIVRQMFTASSCDKRPMHIEPTSGIKRLITTDEHPFNIIQTCAANAKSLKTKSPTYVFFENIRGFHFRSLDSMYAQKSIHTYEPKTAGTMMEKGLHLIKEELENILDYRIKLGQDTLLETDKGIFGSNLIVWNMFDKSYSTKQYDMLKEQENEHNINHYHGTGGDFSPYSNTVDKDGIGISENPSKTFLTSTSDKTTGVNSTFVLDNGNFPISPTDDFDVQQRRKSQMYRINEGLDLEIKVYGNTLISVGDIVTCNIPTKMTVDKSATEILDKRYSGEYLVTHIRHDFNPQEKWKHEMQIKLTRDSIKERIIVQQTTYPNTKPSYDVVYDEYYF